MKYRDDVKYYSRNGELIPIINFPVELASKSGLAYEVLRIKNSLPLFIDEHLQRLKQSILLNSSNQLEISNIKKYIEDIISVNYIIEGNLKLLISPENSTTSVYLYFIPHRYPSVKQVEKGVDLITQRSIRKNPTAKISDWNIRGKANALIDANNIYETVLVNSNGEITEGSRSNIFFIKNEVLFTAKDESVLSGITRQKVIEIARNMKIEIVFSNVIYTNIDNYDSCFITGSSPGVLQVKSIDTIYFNLNNQVYLDIREKYEKMSE